MKKILLFTLLVFIGFNSFGQSNIKGYGFLSVEAGTSLISSSKLLTLRIERASYKSFNWGFSVEHINYSSAKAFTKGFFHSERNLLTGGVYGKLAVANTRNAAVNFHIGGNVGIDTGDDRFVFYPKIGFEQSFWISPKLQWIFTEHIGYFFQDKYSRSFLPTINTGLKFSL